MIIGLNLISLSTSWCISKSHCFCVYKLGLFYKVEVSFIDYLASPKYFQYRKGKINAESGLYLPIFILGPLVSSKSDPKRFYFPWSIIMNSSVQSLSRVWLFVTPWSAARQASPSITNSQSLLKPMSIESVMPSNHLIFCCPLLPPPSVFPSIRVFSSESALRMRWPKYWSFSFSISPSNEYSGLISFRMDWLDLLAVSRDSQESSPTPQLKSINSSVLSFLYSPTLTSIHVYWKNHSFD